MSMIRTLADRGDRRPVTLLYGSRDSDSITFREELEALKARLNLTVVHVLANPPAGWAGEQGFVTADLFQAPSPTRLRLARVFHLRAERHNDGCDRTGAWAYAGTAVEISFRALQLCLGCCRCAACLLTYWSSSPG